MPQPFNPSKGKFATAFITSLVQGIQAAQERNLQESAQDRKTQQQALEGLVKYGQEIGNDEITSLGLSGLIELGEAKTNFLGVLQKNKTLPQARALVSRLSGARRPSSEAVEELTTPQEKPMEGLTSRPVTGLLDLVSGSGSAPSAGPPSMALPATSPTEKGAPPMAPPQVPVMPEDLRFEQNQMGAAAPVKPEINIGAPTPTQGSTFTGKPLDDYTAALKILSQDKYALDPHMAVIRRIYQTHAALGEPIANAREAAILALNPEVGALKRAREAGTTRVLTTGMQVEGRQKAVETQVAGRPKPAPIIRGPIVENGMNVWKLFDRDGNFVRNIAQGEVRLGQAVFTDPDTQEQRLIQFDAYGGGGGTPTKAPASTAPPVPGEAPAEKPKPGIALGRKNAFGDEGKLRKELDSQLKPFKLMEDQILRLRAAGKLQGGASDIAVLVGLAKMLDPETAAREGEVRILREAQSLYESLSTQIARALKGESVIIDPATKARIMDVSERLYQSTIPKQASLFGTYKKLTEDYALNPKRTLGRIPETVLDDIVKRAQAGQPVTAEERALLEFAAGR